MILLFKPFKVGDYIDGAGHSGSVKVINITNTVLLTVDNKTIILPNGTLANGNITNYSNNDTRRVDWTISIEYGNDVDLAKESLLELVNNDPRVLKEPAAPFCALSELSSSSINIVLRVWVKAEDYWSTFYDINEKVYKELPKKGINFPFNQLDVFIKNK
jgi:small conductance mechanosensitive channel